MRIVFCDDDISVMEKLEKYLRAFFADNGMAQPKYDTYISGEELLNSDGRVDIAFLDVEMPGITGITVGKRLKEKYPYAKIFILTSYHGLFGNDHSPYPQNGNAHDDWSADPLAFGHSNLCGLSIQSKAESPKPRTTTDAAEGADCG